MSNISNGIDRAITAMLKKIETGDDAFEAEHCANTIAKLIAARDAFLGDDDDKDDGLSDVLRDAFGDEDGDGDLSLTFRGIARDEALSILRDIQEKVEK